MNIIGIDPGLSGAIACYGPGGLFDVCDLPVVAKGKGGGKVKNEISGAVLARQLDDLIDRLGGDDVLAVVESISSMPGQGVASMFSMGDTFGCIRGVLAAKGIGVELITPQSWKKYYGLPSDKEVCRAKAIALFPDYAGVLSRVKDHNRAEAMLIAKYGYERFGGFHAAA